MPDDAKPAHYTEKFKQEIETLKAENTRLSDALAKASTASVVGPAGPTPDAVRQAQVTQAALFAGCLAAGWEARGGDVASLESILMTRWHAVRRFLGSVATGEDVRLYEEANAKEAAAIAAKAEVERRDREAAEVRREMARKAQAAIAAGSI